MIYMTNNIQLFEVTEEEVDKRLDVYVAEKTDLSRSHIQKLIIAGSINVNEKPAKPNCRLRLSDRIAVQYTEAIPGEAAGEKISLDILYEDADIIVVNKVRGMVVHPAAGNYSGTLVNALLAHCDNLSGINGIIRPGIVHRLDKETSGVIVAAKNDRAHLSLTEQIKKRTAGRQYLAIVHGNIVEQEGTISAPIGRNKTDRKKMAVTFNGSKEATTNFKVLERFGNCNLVKCKLLTGRTHQIRVHMAYIKHPVVGDPKYGPSKNHFSIKGQALHACALCFDHPVSGKQMVFSAPVPADMEKILLELRRNRKG
jgi:23S rRNA pseudouridine1911/1915/1917 synthase